MFENNFNVFCYSFSIKKWTEVFYFEGGKLKTYLISLKTDLVRELCVLVLF